MTKIHITKLSTGLCTLLQSSISHNKPTDLLPTIYTDHWLTHKYISCKAWTNSVDYVPLSGELLCISTDMLRIPNFFVGNRIQKYIYIHIHIYIDGRFLQTDNREFYILCVIEVLKFWKLIKCCSCGIYLILVSSASVRISSAYACVHYCLYLNSSCLRHKQKKKVLKTLCNALFPMQSVEYHAFLVSNRWVSSRKT